MKIIFRVIFVIVALFFIKVLMCNIGYWNIPIYNDIFQCLCIPKENKERGFKVGVIYRISCSNDIIKIFKSKYNRIPSNYIELKKFFDKKESQNYLSHNYFCFSDDEYKIKGVSLENIAISNELLLDERYFNIQELEKGFIIYITNKSKTNYALYGLDPQKKLVNYAIKSEEAMPFYKSNVDLTEAFEKMGEKFDQ